jgi:hypothetical protein
LRAALRAAPGHHRSRRDGIWPFNVKDGVERVWFGNLLRLHALSSVDRGRAVVVRNNTTTIRNGNTSPSIG